MNKYQEALVFLHRLATQDTRWIGVKYDEHLNSLKEIVRRATPRKPVGVVGKCAGCGTFDNYSEEFETELNFCSNCGQAQDWSKEDGKA